MNFSSLRAGSGRSFRPAESKQRSSTKTRSVKTCASGPSGAGQPKSLRELAGTVATTVGALGAIGTVSAPLVGLFIKMDIVEKRLDRLENRVEEMQATLHKICGKLGI